MRQGNILNYAGIVTARLVLSLANDWPVLCNCYSMVKQFIVQCLFFRSEERLHKVFGALTWASILLFVYAIVNLWRSW